MVKRKIPTPCRESNPPNIHHVAQCCTTELSRLPHALRSGSLVTSKYFKLPGNRFLSCLIEEEGIRGVSGIVKMDEE
jgi:hypothetical protein